MSVLTGEIRSGVVLAGRYRVLKPLGAGGMATVFLAEDERLGREVAIKRLHTDAPEASLKRFKQEARLGAALNHPSLVAIYDTLVTDEEGALIVMEYVPGRSLAELAAGRAMRPSRALPILRAVAEALDHAHAAGVVHRDVKPGNVIVCDDGTVKLADLGIARAIGANQITSEGSVVGTLPYMSPERLAGPGAGGPESDVYALGAVAYELLSGQPPSTVTSTEQAQARGPLDLGREWPQGPPAAVAVLERGLDDDPARRPPTAGRLVEDLEAGLKRGASVPAPFDPGVPTTRVPASPRTATRGTRTRRAPADSLGAGLGDRAGRARRAAAARPAAVAAVALALLAVAAVAFNSGGDDGGGKGQPVADAKAKEAKPKREPKVKPEPAPQPEPAPAPEPTSGAALNDLGFSLSNQGRYEEAVDVLQRAVDSFPEGSDDITYAFALYNLGHALRMAGRPDEAIPVLQRRLEFPNQTGTVRRELAAAYAESGQGFDAEPGPVDGHGHEGGHGGPGPGDGFD